MYKDIKKTIISFLVMLLILVPNTIITHAEPTSQQDDYLTSEELFALADKGILISTDGVRVEKREFQTNEFNVEETYIIRENTSLSRADIKASTVEARAVVSYSDQYPGLYTKVRMYCTYDTLTYMDTEWRKITYFGHQYLTHDGLFGRPTRIETQAMQRGTPQINSAHNEYYNDLSDSISSTTINSTVYAKNTNWTYYAPCHTGWGVSYITTTVTFLERDGDTTAGSYTWYIISPNS